MTGVHSGIYRIYCNVNGRSYIGSSTHLRERMRTTRNKLSYGSNGCFEMQDDYKLYGADSFECEVLEYLPNATPKELLVHEFYYCLLFNSFSKSFGYNKKNPITEALMPQHSIRHKPIIGINTITGKVLRFESTIDFRSFIKGYGDKFDEALAFWSGKLYEYKQAKSYKGYIPIYEENYDPQRDYAGEYRDKFVVVAKPKPPKVIRVKKEKVIKEKIPPIKIVTIKIDTGLIEYWDSSRIFTDTVEYGSFKKVFACMSYWGGRPSTATKITKSIKGYLVIRESEFDPKVNYLQHHTNSTQPPPTFRRGY